ncbi:hypothetical protein E5A73_10970 [Sphingomonas gei]|uniref:HEAT repeat domain-containing protein n=1 Tax=Sphingomonas gei TaxID=1395960 RepID=A0A4V3QZ93_9SPHN|nr:hypothetical protein [Sphingomonas gei]TGX53362.1 hypothetical protein E5A73_10970 [Sphingomonas gei]
MHRISVPTRAAMARAREQSGATMRQWRDGAEYRAATDAFDGCGACPERAAACAEGLLRDDSWAGALVAPLIRTLEADPLFDPSLKFHRDSRRVGAVLFDCPTASIAARVNSAAAMATLPPLQTIVFTGRIAVTRVVKAGGAQLRRWHATFASPEPGAACVARFAGTRPLDDGEVYRTDGRDQAQLICGAASDVVTLVATIRAGAAPLIREHDLASGALVRVSDADDRPSRTAMLLRFLRVAGRADAAECFEEATHAPEFHLRWAAMREWLALDAARAAPRLAEMAATDANHDVRAAASLMVPRVEARLAGRCRG